MERQVLSRLKRKPNGVRVCNGNQWCSITLGSQRAPTPPSIRKGEVSVGNFSPSFMSAKAVWPLCWNLNLQHLFLQHIGKVCIVSACEVEENKGRSKSSTLMHWELCGYRCSSGDLRREFHWVHRCILSLKEIKIKLYEYASFTMTSLNPE